MVRHRSHSIEFKRQVYEQALNELARFLDSDHRRWRREAGRRRGAGRGELGRNEQGR